MSEDTETRTKLTILLFLIVFILLSAFGILASRLYSSYQSFYADGGFSQSVAYVVKKGAKLEQIAAELKEKGLIINDADFCFWTKIKGEDKKIKAGEYAIPAFASPFMIMNIITKGSVVVHKITFPEGLTTAEMLAILKKDESLSGDVGEEFTDLSNGTLLPSTYHFSLGDTREGLLQRMQESFNRQAEALWLKRQEDLPFNTLFEAVILASIVEKEATLSKEKPIIASVFINRLRKGMKLQSDPTVLFALSGGKSSTYKRVLYKDLQIDNPYNTYKYEGLPPTPICNVGMDTLEAVLNPAKTDYLYFVVDVNKPKAHVFSATYKEHTKNANNFRNKKKAERAAAKKKEQDKDKEKTKDTKKPENEPPAKAKQTDKDKKTEAATVA